MAETQVHSRSDPHNDLQSVHPTGQSTAGAGGVLTTQDTPSSLVGLLGDSRLSGRGNSPVRQALLLQLQRTYGNRATQLILQRLRAGQAQPTPTPSGTFSPTGQLSAESIRQTGPPGEVQTLDPSTVAVIQRKVGLEFQTGVHLTSTEQLQEGEPLVQKDGWYVVADEVKAGGTKGDLEFVTAPFEDKGSLVSAAKQARNAGEKIDEKKDPNSIIPETTPLSAFVPGAPNTVNVEHPNSAVTAAPQATYDVPLSRVTKLFKRMTKPLLGQRFGGEPSNEGTWSLSGESPKEGQVLRNSAELIEKWFADNVENPDLYRNLMGLASMILSYVINAGRQRRDEPLSYAKLIAPVMSRTSFSSLWKQLTKLERDFFLRKVHIPEFDEESDGNSSDEESVPEESDGNSSDEESVPEESDGNSSDEESVPEESDGNSSDEESVPEESDGNSSDEESVPEEREDEDSDEAKNFRRWMDDMVELYVEKFNVGEEEAPDTGLFPGGYKDEKKGEKSGPRRHEWLISIVDSGEGDRDLLSPPKGGSPAMGKYEATSATAMLELRRMPKGLLVSQWDDFAARVFDLYTNLVPTEQEEDT